MPIRGTHRARSGADLRARPVFFPCFGISTKGRGSITALRMPPVRAGAELAHRRDTDRRRREVDNATEKFPVLVTLLHAEQRVGMPEKRSVDFVPIRVGQLPRSER